VENLQPAASPSPPLVRKKYSPLHSRPVHLEYFGIFLSKPPKKVGEIRTAASKKISHFFVSQCFPELIGRL
jgi:hypothetical protein